MCKAFSAIVTKDDRVIWQAGIDSHDDLISQHKLKDDTTDGDLIKFAKVEITPDKGYLYPEEHWTFKLDENTTPRWWRKRHEAMAHAALEEWKVKVYSGINLKEVLNPINPLNLPKREPTAEDIKLLKKWDSVWASVGGSVGDSVWVYIGSLFTGIEKWRYIDRELGIYPFQPAVDLWKRGLVASYDGKVWRLHSGKKAEIVWKGKL